MTERPLLVSRKIDFLLRALHDAFVVALHVEFQGPECLEGPSTVVTEKLSRLVMRIGTQFHTSSDFLFDQPEMLVHLDVESKDGTAEITEASVDDHFLSRHVHFQLRLFVPVTDVDDAAVLTRLHRHGESGPLRASRLDAFPKFHSRQTVWCIVKHFFDLYRQRQI